jgi:predicted RNase H-like HicB family nuclease
MRFPVVLHADKKNHYGVTVPDLPGCFSAGNSVEEALDSAQEAIDLHLDGLTEDGVDLPVLASIAQHQKNPDFKGGTWALVDVDVSKYDGKAEKINITLPRRLLVKIDSYASSHRLTRSGFLADAARTAMR